MSVTARFSFPAGRYHATPWARHVNEGAIEWPPSPWRLLRALLSVGFNRLGWSTGVPAEAAGLLEALASTAPRYLLPTAAASHTRHYMPKYKDKPTKVLDTFAVLERVDAPLWVAWDVELAGPHRHLLEQMLKALPYLGRAESWVEAGLDSEPAGVWVRHGPRAPSSNWERVDLLAPMTSNGFAEWRSEAVGAELAVELEAVREAATRNGKAAPNALTARQRQAVEQRLPTDVVSALCMDTGTLQQEGWSLPPGSRWLTYWRPDTALSRPATRQRMTRNERRIDTVLFAVTSETVSGERLPSLKDALPRGELVHQSLVALASKFSTGEIQLSGRQNGAPARGHRHPFVLPVSLEATRTSGWDPSRAGIDHVLVHVAPDIGFDQASLKALRSLRRTWASGIPGLWLTPVWEGRATDSNLPWVRASDVWTSHTPFVAPRHLKKSGANSLAGQIRAELEERGLPMPSTIEYSAEVAGTRSWLDASDFWPVWNGPTSQRRLDLRWRSFRRDRRKPRPQVEHQPAIGIRLRFSNAVHGPIALGYGCHLGLGCFVSVS